MKAFIESQFGYCPLIWMFHSSGVNSKINHLHERLNNISSFEDLLNPICPGDGGGGDTLRLPPSVFGCCILTGRTLKLILYDFDL